MRPNFVTEKLKKILPVLGATLIVEPYYGYCGCILFDNGKRTFYKESSFDVNPQGAVKVAIDKGYSNCFLQQFGFKVPPYDTFVDDTINAHLKYKKGMEEGLVYAQKIGFPVILKPNAGTKGKHVYKVNNPQEYDVYASRLLADTNVMLVQEFVTGNDFRIVVFNNKVYCAYQRVPLHIEGNGMDTIAQLLIKKKQQLNSSINTFNPQDKRIIATLRQLGRTDSDVLTEGEILPLLHLANLSLGGQAIDWTSRISEEYKSLAIDITNKMGLKLCGVDIMTDRIDGKVKDYAVIEINSAPGYSNYALLGEKQSIIVENLYRDILLYIRNIP